MAEIEIERHERRIWPWVLGLLVLALLAWWLLYMRGTDADGNVAIETTAGTVIDSVPGTSVGTRESAPAAVNDFLSYVEENRAEQSADSTHTYQAEGLRRLAAALDELADRDTIGSVSLDSRITALRNRADALQRNWRSTEHARYTREAFDSAAVLVEGMQRQRFSNIANEAAQLRQAASGVAPDRLLLEQKAEVQRFFQRAADAVRAMANTRTSAT